MFKTNTGYSRYSGTSKDSVFNNITDGYQQWSQAAEHKTFKLN